MRCRSTRTARSAGARCRPRRSRARTKPPSPIRSSRRSRTFIRKRSAAARCAPTTISSRSAGIRCWSHASRRAFARGSASRCRSPTCSRIRRSRRSPRTCAARPPRPSRRPFGSRAPGGPRACRSAPRSSGCGCCRRSSRTAPITTFAARSGCTARSISSGSRPRSRKPSRATRRCAPASRGRTAKRARSSCRRLPSPWNGCRSTSTPIAPRRRRTTRPCRRGSTHGKRSASISRPARSSRRPICRSPPTTAICC
ncbi:Uncharacterised protein [Burkholderia pseudomallei]|nr:Uncharacterised protein [Burkholderia pseudomallei]